MNLPEYDDALMEQVRTELIPYLKDAEKQYGKNILGAVLLGVAVGCIGTARTRQALEMMIELDNKGAT